MLDLVVRRMKQKGCLSLTDPEMVHDILSYELSLNGSEVDDVNGFIDDILDNLIHEYWKYDTVNVSLHDEVTLYDFRKYPFFRYKSRVNCLIFCFSVKLVILGRRAKKRLREQCNSVKKKQKR